MGRKLRTVYDALGVPVIPHKERPSHCMNVLQHIPPVGSIFCQDSIVVPGCTRRDINTAIKTLVRMGVLRYRRMGIIERLLDAP